MKEGKKKGKAGIKEKEEGEYEKCIEELADVIVEGMHGEHHSEFEPLEIYVAKVKAKVHANMDEFRSRFSKGYHVLLEELQKQSPQENKPKPGSIRP